MVTFTKAAVAELEDRVRLFIRSAYKSAEGKEIGDNNIAQLVQSAITAQGIEPVQQQLKDALLFLDETSVLTIHSFCQQALNEFAFETFQLFGADMQPDFAPVIEEELNKFWRRHITTLPADLLHQIWFESLRDYLKEVLKNHSSGKKYPGYIESTHYVINKSKQDAWLQQLRLLKEQALAKETTLHAYITDNDGELRTLCEGNANAKKTLLPSLSDPAGFVEIVRDKKVRPM